MTEMEELVARAIFDKLRPALDASNFLRMASLGISDGDVGRAAIEAMREPTEAMVKAAMAADGTSMPLARGYDEVWRSMIDEAVG